MGSGHSAHLHVDGTTALHRMPAHAKLVGLVAFVLLVVSVPPQDHLALVGLLVLAVAVLLSTRVPVRHLLPRLAVELPFAVFALLLPFVAVGPQVELGPFTVSQAGLDAAVALLLKGTDRGGGGRGVRRHHPRRATSCAPSSTCGCPTHWSPSPGSWCATSTSSATRCAGCASARASRGFTARSVRSWPPLAASTGALFIRSFERGERVHLAMVSRGWSGRMPVTEPLVAAPAQWVLALVPAAVAAVVTVGVRLG